MVKQYPMKIIIEDADDYILQVRAARTAIQYWNNNPLTETRLIEFEDGNLYLVKRNKNSVRVYRYPGNK